MLSKEGPTHKRIGIMKEYYNDPTVAHNEGEFTCHCIAKR